MHVQQVHRVLQAADRLARGFRAGHALDGLTHQLRQCLARFRQLALAVGQREAGLRQSGIGLQQVVAAPLVDAHDLLHASLQRGDTVHVVVGQLCQLLLLCHFNVGIGHAQCDVVARGFGTVVGAGQTGALAVGLVVGAAAVIDRLDGLGSQIARAAVAALATRVAH